MPLVKKIRISEVDISVDRAYNKYNEELSNTIDSEFDRSLLILHPIIPADHFLWEWALDWKSKFLEHGKLLSILTSDKSQSDALNGLHLKPTKKPTSNSISHDLELLYKDLMTDEINAKDIKDTLNTVKHISQNNDMVSSNILVKPEERFEITGEYSCDGCGLSNVFIKGEIAPTCRDENCLGLSDGWHLKVELF